MDVGDIGGKTETDPCFYIGIDFGTTYSGVAYAFSGDPDNLSIVRGWPSKERSHVIDDAKVPTRIAYSDELSQPEWGHNIAPGRQYISWFKLLLVKSGHLPPSIRDSDFLAEARELLQKAGKTAQQAVSDYLRLIWAHTMQEMERELGKESVRLQFKVVVTVPAIWKPYAVKAMEEAAELAGLLAHRSGCKKTELRVVSEPEAAAMATLWGARKKHTYRANDVYTVCDIGGGTTDIISYKVLNLDPLELAECVEGIGDLCGAIFVDEAFRNYLRRKFGSKWNKISDRSKERLLNDDWEHGIKRRFCDTADAVWSVQVPSETVKVINTGSAKKNIKQGCIEITTGELKGVFGRTLDRSRELINKQILSAQASTSTVSKKPKAIILVGGFGSCRYIYNALREEHEANSIEILQPRGDEPWTAICRGAVLKARFQGTRSAVLSRKSRFHYGIVEDLEYSPGLSHLRHTLYTDRWGSERVTSMRWYIHKGDDMYTLKPLKVLYYERIPSSTTGRATTDLVIQCSDRSKPPDDPNDPSIQETHRLHYKLPVYYENLPKKVSRANGKSFRDLHYAIEMDSADAQVKFSVWYNDARQEQRTIDSIFDTLTIKNDHDSDSD